MSLLSMDLIKNRIYKRLNYKPGIGFTCVMVIISLSFIGFICLILLSLVVYINPLRTIDNALSMNTVNVLFLSLQTSFIVSGMTFLFGLPVAYVLSRYSFAGKPIIETVVEIPMVLPPLVSGMALIILFNPNSFIGKLLTNFDITIIFTKKGIVICQLFVASPFFIKTVREAIDAIPNVLFKASQVLNASPIFTFMHVVLPIIKPSIITGLILTWARAMGEFGATAMVAGAIPGYTETLTVAIYKKAAVGDIESATTLSLILMSISFFVMFIFKKLKRSNYGNKAG